MRASIPAMAATGYPKAEEALGFLRADPERPHRISTLIEENAARN